MIRFISTYVTHLQPRLPPLTEPFNLPFLPFSPIFLILTSPHLLSSIKQHPTPASSDLVSPLINNLHPHTSHHLPSWSSGKHACIVCSRECLLQGSPLRGVFCCWWKDISLNVLRCASRCLCSLDRYLTKSPPSTNPIPVSAQSIPPRTAQNFNLQPRPPQHLFLVPCFLLPQLTTSVALSSSMRVGPRYTGHEEIQSVVLVEIRGHMGHMVWWLLLSRKTLQMGVR